MGKSSTSHKKKRSKKSLKVRVSGKSKSRKHRSKKLRRQRKTSLSVSDLDSSLSSSSEDSYRSRRARSSKRKDDKGRRKMAKRRSYRHESSDDSRHDRKRKRAKRKKSEQEAREKPYKKKKLRKDGSVSSMSNGSLSCSTCYAESASSDDSNPERHRGRLERKGNEKDRRSDRGKSESDRYRARSHSSCSFSSESSDERTEEKYVSKNNSMRLKSVIIVAEVAEEARELCPNQPKEEIVDDHDYPCRSNDSNDGDSKRESDHHSLPSSREKLGIDDTQVDRIADSNLTEPERDQRYNNNDSQFDRSELDVYGAGTGESVEKKTSETSGASLDGEDLEAILRKRALENLRKFRGEVQSSAKASSQKIRIDNDVIQPPIESHEPVQGKSIVNYAGKAGKFDKITNTEGINLATVRRKSVASSSEHEKDVNGVKGESVSLKHHSSCAPEKVTDIENHSETITDNAIDRHGSDPVNSSNDNVKNIRALCSKGQDEVKDHCQFELKRASDLDKLHHTKSPPNGGNEDQNAAAKTHDVDKPCASVIDKPSSESSPVENSSNNLQGEASQGSQFEQKTMNVMRGGEMVQVSYKVYIPNKTPALARRKLKR